MTIIKNRECKNIMHEVKTATYKSSGRDYPKWLEKYIEQRDIEYLENGKYRYTARKNMKEYKIKLRDRLDNCIIYCPENFLNGYSIWNNDLKNWDIDVYNLHLDICDNEIMHHEVKKINDKEYEIIRK
jgi:hypothetical protein